MEVDAGRLRDPSPTAPRARTLSTANGRRPPGRAWAIVPTLMDNITAVTVGDQISIRCRKRRETRNGFRKTIQPGRSVRRTAAGTAALLAHLFAVGVLHVGDDRRLTCVAWQDQRGQHDDEADDHRDPGHR